MTILCEFSGGSLGELINRSGTLARWAIEQPGVTAATIELSQSLDSPGGQWLTVLVLAAMPHSSELNFPTARIRELEEAANRSVLDTSTIPEAVIIESVAVLRAGHDKFVVRVRSREGAEGLAVGNELQLGFLYPLLKERIVPYLLGKDARDWELLLEGVYRYRSNYKLQGLAFWLPLATVEFAVLDFLGNISGRAVPELLGGYVRKTIPLYYAHNDRDLPAKESAERLAATVKQTGAQALKFKVGGRMSRNADSLPGRTEQLIPLAREAVGPDVTLYADSNGSSWFVTAPPCNREAGKSRFPPGRVGGLHWTRLGSTAPLSSKFAPKFQTFERSAPCETQGVVGWSPQPQKL